MSAAFAQRRVHLGRGPVGWCAAEPRRSPGIRRGRALLDVVREQEVVGGDLGGDGLALLAGAPDDVDRAAAGHVLDVVGAADGAVEADVALDGDFLGDAGPADEAQSAWRPRPRASTAPRVRVASWQCCMRARPVGRM